MPTVCTASAVLRAAIGGVREILGRAHELRDARADRDGDRRVALQGGRIALHHARGLLHLGIRVDDHEPAHVVAGDEVDDALVGERRHDQVGERAQRRVGSSERASCSPIAARRPSALRARRSASYTRARSRA